MEKPENVLRSKTTNRHTAFKITIRGDCLCFGIKADQYLHKEKETSFLTLCMAKFSLTVTSFRQYKSLSQRNFFILIEWYPFFLPWTCILFDNLLMSV